MCCTLLHFTLLCWSFISVRWRVLSDMKDWIRRSGPSHWQDALPAISLSCKGIFLAYWALFLSAGKDRKQTPLSMAVWEFSFLRHSKALNKGLRWTILSFHPQQWIKVLLWAGKLQEISIMAQPSLEDWTFHAQTIQLKKKSVRHSELQRTSYAPHKQMHLVDLKPHAFFQKA